MIKYFLLLLLLPLSLFSSKILSYNIYERTDRADVMITFDTPYHGNIKQSISNSKIIIKLRDASIESSKIKKVSSPYLQSLAITKLKGQTQLVALVSPSVRLIASKTTDAYGLRLRFTSKVTQAPMINKQLVTQQNPFSALPTKKNSDMSSSYYIVVGILILGIIILMILKNKIQGQQPKKSRQAKNSWLFKSTDQVNDIQAQKTDYRDVSIRFQKLINDKNSVVMLDFGVESYLVLMGNSNILLDKFTDNKPSNQEEFESVLQSRNQELEDFLGSNYSEGSRKEPLQAYKEKAASLIYSNESIS
ncbi:hypothetical protein [Sulfurimonas sp.]|jgi:hypothetical protein|uniref:hypothetical protein n=1 Tax=Sulfurimonas sp. TaxID=2022749 RepID=UPI0025CCEE9A|nr:hypothetical protein [Sulfurimonas sp.]MBT5935119.1 hypothetical protein [Sulfurimonas sp.]